MDATIATEDHVRSDQPGWRLWAKILRFAWPHRRAMFGLIGTSVVLAVADATLTLVPRGLVNELEAHGRQAALWPWALLYTGLSVLFCGCVYTFIRLGGKLWTHVAHDMRETGFARLQDLSFSYYDKRSTGWLTARLTSDVTKLTRILSWGMLDLVWGSCFLLGLAGIMLWANWRVAVWVLPIAVPLAWAGVVFQRKILAASRATRRKNSEIIASFTEGIQGVRTTKTLARERENLDEFEGLTGQMYQAALREALYRAMYVPITVSLGSLATGLALWYGGRGVLAGQMSLGDVVLFINCTLQMVFPIQELSYQLANLQAARASAERVLELVETEPEIQDAPHVREAVARAARTAPREGQAEDGLPDAIDRIQFENVSFAYDADEPVLREFSLTVERGQTIALVGPTGGGKTTIVSLLCRFYEPTSGRILLDGVDYRDRSLHWLQSRLGIVLQAPRLFTGTIRENIRYGRLDATDDEVAQAARLVNAHTFIDRLEHGYDTPVGEGGGSLSVGQKQLVSFARAVLADPLIFVMDEATSSVDTESEQLIQAGLHRVLEGRISFVIAHRLSTIRGADLILVIDAGRTVEQGTHADLIRRRGRYYQLYTQQFTREKEDDLLR